MSDGRIPVPPVLIVAVVVALMALSGAVGFLLASRPETAVAPTAAPAPTAAVSPPPAAAPSPDPATPPATTATPPAPQRRAAPAASEQPAPEAKAPAHQAAVRRYLAALDQIGGDPAMSSPDVYVQQALSGDTSGIDGLITEHERRRAAIARLDPPPPATAHHAALMDLADQGISLMRSLREGIATMDIGTLSSLQPRAQRLQASGDRVTKMEQELRSRYGG